MSVGASSFAVQTGWRHGDAPSALPLTDFVLQVVDFPVKPVYRHHRLAVPALGAAVLYLAGRARQHGVQPALHGGAWRAHAAGMGPLG